MDYVLTEPSIITYMQSHESVRPDRIMVNVGTREEPRLEWQNVQLHFIHLGFDENNLPHEMGREDFERCVLNNTQIHQDVCYSHFLYNIQNEFFSRKRSRFFIQLISNPKMHW